MQTVKDVTPLKLSTPQLTTPARSAPRRPDSTPSVTVAHAVQVSNAVDVPTSGFAHESPLAARLSASLRTGAGVETRSIVSPTAPVVEVVHGGQSGGEIVETGGEGEEIVALRPDDSGLIRMLAPLPSAATALSFISAAADAASHNHASLSDCYDGVADDDTVLSRQRVKPPTVSELLGRHPVKADEEHSITPSEGSIVPPSTKRTVRPKASHVSAVSAAPITSRDDPFLHWPPPFSLSWYAVPAVFPRDALLASYGLRFELPCLIMFSVILC